MRDDEQTARIESALQTIGTWHDAVQNAEEMQRETVENAREAGATWDEIAGALGVSRQAATQRYRAPGLNAFERNTVAPLADRLLFEY